MVIGLIPPYEERRLFQRLIGYYRKIHPSEKFGDEEKMLRHGDIGEVYYTFPGEEAEATAEERMKQIRDAITYGYDTPVILLRKGRKLILLDGHRRLRVAWEKKMPWRALIISTPARKKFGIEKMVMGKVRDLW